MPPNYTVRARVIDIRTDTPQPTDAFFVDTNVWFWAEYSGAGAFPGSVTQAQITEYPTYAQRIDAVGAVRYHTPLTFVELAHLIEDSERDAYAGYVAPVTPKEYRHNLPNERARVVGVVQGVWTRVASASHLLPVTLDSMTITAASARFATNPMDGYDLFLLEAMSSAGVTKILTDDGDFSGVLGLEVFTSNPRVLAAARTAGLLVVR